MKIAYHISISGSNSCGTRVDFSCFGVGDALDYSLANLKVSNKLHKLQTEELAVSLANLDTFLKTKK